MMISRTRRMFCMRETREEIGGKERERLITTIEAQI